jgi:hypothetical protein
MFSSNKKLSKFSISIPALWFCIYLTLELKPGTFHSGLLLASTLAFLCGIAA